MITFVTGNKSKINEIVSVFGDTIVMKSIDLPEIQSLDFKEVIKAKLLEARKYIPQGAIIVDDAGYCFEALGKLPGPFSKFFLEALGYEGIHDLILRLGNPQAFHICNIGYMDENSTVSFFTASIQGKIVSPQGEGGFGFDPLFIPEGKTKTFAELPTDELYVIRPRIVAAKQLKDFLDKQVIN